MVDAQLPGSKHCAETAAAELLANLVVRDNAAWANRRFDINNPPDDAGPNAPPNVGLSRLQVRLLAELLNLAVELLNLDQRLGGLGSIALVRSKLRVAHRLFDYGL